MKIVSPLPRKRGRIEIIPLIDIMFFLLAAFMMVSINKIKVNSLHIVLPTDVPTLQKETKEDFISISVDTNGQLQLDKERITTKEMFLDRLKALYAKNKEQKILISADKETHHGDVMQILGKIRQAGFQRVAFSIKNEHTPNAGKQSDLPTAPGDGTPMLTPPAGPGAPAPSTGVPAAPSTAVPSAVAPAPAPEPSAPTAPAPAAPSPPTGQ